MHVLGTAYNIELNQLWMSKACCHFKKAPVIVFSLTLKMTTTQVVKTSVTVNNNSPILDYVHPDDQTQPTFEMTPGFKPFTMRILITLLELDSFVRCLFVTNMQYIVMYTES